MNENKLNDVISKIKNKPLLALLFLFGVIMLVFGEGLIGKADTTEKSDSSFVVRSYTEELERRAAALISSVSGVSDVKIMITLDCGSEYVYAENSDAGLGEYLIINSQNGEEPVLVKEIFASVRGIGVVCRGGDNVNVKKTVTDLLSSAFGIPTSKISVAGSDL